MKRKLALVVLALLVVGLASQAVALWPIKDPRCQSSQYTSTWYLCPNCSEWFVLPCESGTGQLPPAWAEECPLCEYSDQEIRPAYAVCFNPNCVGGVFWSA